jgi:nucleotide-binding universal stress UspA family protein
VPVERGSSSQGSTSAGDPPFPSALIAVGQPSPENPVDPRIWALARRLAARLTVCHVVLRPTTAAANETDGSPANAEETAILGELRNELVAAYGEGGRDLTVKILHGDPGQRICEYADFLASDLIIVGPREKATLAKALRGSVSKFVAATSRRHVLVLGDG